MPGSAAPDTVRDGNVDRALLECLRQLSACDFPGVDGMTAADVVHCYPVLAHHGRVPGREELLRRHPEWAEKIDALFRVPAQL